MVEHSFVVWKKPMKNMWIYHGKFHWIFMGFNFIVLVTKSAGFFGGKKGLKFSFNLLKLFCLDIFDQVGFY